MEDGTSMLGKKKKLVLPPKRGEVLKKILKGIFGRRRDNEGSGGLGSYSSSSTPAATPSGYNSDAASET